MIDLELRAANEAAMIAGLPMMRTINETGQAVWCTSKANVYELCLIGTITGTAGFHANVRLIDASLKPVIEAAAGITVLDPVLPKVVWA